MSSGKNKENLYVGQVVEINPRADKSRKVIISGIISEILSNTNFHPHGILVKLSSGEIGRVKNLTPNASIDHTNQSVSFSSNKRNSINEILSGGENHFTEFKSSLLWSERLTLDEIGNSKSKYVKLYGRDASKAIVASTIAAFLNADGGELVIGIAENKNSNKDEVVGIESEYSKLKDPCEDGYRRKILDAIIKPFFPSFIFNHFNKYISISFSQLDGKTLCLIHVEKSDDKVFLTIKNKKSFYVRIDASSRELSGEEVVDYCMKRFA